MGAGQRRVKRIPVGEFWSAGIRETGGLRRQRDSQPARKRHRARPDSTCMAMRAPVRLRAGGAADLLRYAANVRLAPDVRQQHQQRSMEDGREPPLSRDSGEGRREYGARVVRPPEGHGRESGGCGRLSLRPSWIE